MPHDCVAYHQSRGSGSALVVWRIEVTVHNMALDDHMRQQDTCATDPEAVRPFAGVSSS